MAIECVQNHKAFIYERGGRRRVDEIRLMSELSWNRVRDDISESQIKLSVDSCRQQEDVLKNLESGIHEVVIFRGNKRVWEGPVTRPVITRGGMTIHSRDVMHYAYRTALRKVYSSALTATTSESAVRRAARVLRGELAVKEALGYNLIPHIRTIEFPTDAKTRKINKPHESDVWSHIDNMAAKGGIDYTVVGRSIVIWDTSRPIGRTPTATEADFLGDISITQYGMDLATSSTVTNGDGLWAEAGGIDPIYGQVDLVTTAYDEDGSETPTQAVLFSQAQRNLNGRNPVPVLVKVPENASVNPSSPVLTMDAMVPGVYVPLLADFPIRRVSQMQKISSMKVKETADQETISITLTAASGSDDTGEDD